MTILDEQNVNINVEDIEIGAVELKDADADTRAKISAAGVAVGNGVHILAGSDGTNARFVSTDTGGQVQTAHDANTNPIFAKITDGTNEVTVLTDNGAFASGSKGLALLGKYQASPVAYTDGDAAPVLLDAQGRVVLSSDIQIGAVELKDGSTDTRGVIASSGATAAVGLQVLAGSDGTNARFLSVDATGGVNCNATYTEFATASDGGALPTLLKVAGGYDGSAVQVLKTDSDGNLQVDILTIASGAGPINAQQSGTWILGANSGVDIGDVTINNASGSSAVYIQDGGNSITVDAVNLDIRDLISASDSVAAVQSGTWTVTATDGGGSLTVDGTVAATQSGTWNIGTVTALTGITNALPAGDNNIGNVDIVTIASGAGPINIQDGAGSITVDASNLDIRDLTSASDSVSAVQSGTWIVTATDGGGSLTVDQSGTWNIGTVTALTGITNALPSGDNNIGNVDIVTIASGAGPISIQDGAGSITVDASNLDIRDLTSVSDSISAAQSGTWTVTATDGGGSLTVDASNLDIRDLTSVSDSVSAVQSGTWTVTATDGGGSLTVDGTLAATQSGTWNIGTVTALTSITNALPAGDNNIGNVDIVTIASGAGPINIQDGAGSITVDASNLDIRDLTSVSDSVSAAQSGTWTVTATDGGGSLTVDGTVAATQSGTWNVGTLTGITNALPAGDNNIGNVDIVTIASGAGPISIQDGGNSITVDGTFWQTTQPVSATDLDIRDLTRTSDSVAIWSNTTATGGGTALQPLVDADGHQQIDILSIASGSGPINAAQQGTWNIGTVTTLTGITNALPAGTNYMGKVRVTDGTTDTNVSTTCSGALKVAVPNRTTIAFNQVTVASAGTRQQLASNTVPDGCVVTVKAKPANTGYIYVGDSTVTSSNGYILDNSESISLAVTNSNIIYVDSSVNAEGICWVVEI